MSSSKADRSALSKIADIGRLARGIDFSRLTVLSVASTIAILTGAILVALMAGIGLIPIWVAMATFSVTFFAAVAATMWFSPRHKARQSVEASVINQILEPMGDAVLRFDQEGELTFVSSTAAQLFGCQKYELGGQGLVERTHVMDRPLLLTTLSNVRSTGKQSRVELRMRRDGVNPGQVAPEFIWVEISVSATKDKKSDDAPFDQIVLIRDISKKKSDDARILSAQMAAENALQTRSHFLATVGHELRTPLNAIVGFSDMLATGVSGELTSEQTEYAELIGQSGRHLLEVINSLLDMSRIEAGKFELGVEPFEPERLVAPCLQILSKPARERDIDIDVSFGKALPEIVADERACRQIVINLLSNAIKFSNVGGSVKWSMRPQGRYLNLTISDSGIGMSNDYLAELGEPFSQAHKGHERRYEGTGLGVSIVKGLVELHQGVFKVSSQSGLGTAITVLLPIDGPKRAVDSSDVTTLHPETEQKPEEKWPEQKSAAI